MTDEHAKVGASSAKQWMNCPPSIELGSQFPDTTSKFAEEGTLAHSIAEAKLRHMYEEGYSAKEFMNDMGEFKTSEYYSRGMLDYVQDYVDLVAERILLAEERAMGVYLAFEERLDTSRWIPEGFGTGDVVVASGDTLEIIDLKYGKGVPVSAIENPQLRIYGASALLGLPEAMLKDITTVRMTIVQPRLDSVTTDEMTVGELMDWMMDEVGPQAEKAFRGEGEYKAGEHCMFCKAKHVCTTRADYMLSIEELGYSDPNLLTAEQIAEILPKLDQLKKWADGVKQFALDRAMTGAKFPGHKLVRGRAPSRKFSDLDDVRITLELEGFKQDEFMKPPELQPLGTIESLVGKRSFLDLFSRNVVRGGEGKPTLVSESDGRDEWMPNEEKIALFDELE